MTPISSKSQNETSPAPERIDVMPDASLRIFPVGVSPLVSELLSRLASPPVDRSVPVALRALQAFLARAPTVADLNAATMFDFSSTLIDRGISPETADRYLHAVRRLATAAVAEGLLEKSDVPRLPRWRGRWSKAKTRPWSIDELSQLFAALRTLRGTVSGIPASTWWTALLLTSLDLQQSAAPLVALSGPAFDPAAGTLTIGMYVYTTHARTAAAIAELRTGQAPRLFPWELDESATPGGEPLYMLTYDFRKILKRARLPDGRLDLFRRLRFTAEEDPDVIGKIDWERRIEQPHGADESPAALEVSMKPRRRRGNPRWADAGKIALGSHSKTTKPKTGPDVYTIDNPSDRTIRAFFETVYIPRRLAYGSPDTAVAYRGTINRLREFCLCEPTLDCLNDDLVENFLAYWRPFRAVDSLKRMRGELLALWRYAWRKRRVETQPRDIDEIRTPKRLAECYSIDELDRLLTVAGSIEGKVGASPASLYWPALILFLVEVGLRVGAAMRVTVANFDSDRGWVRAEWQTQKQKATQDLPISAQMVRMLLATQPAGRKLLFPWPFRDRKQTMNIRLRALLTQAGLPTGRRDLWHKFRRTCATFIADVAGELEAQKQLGHASISTTRKYLDVRKLRRARIVDHPDLQRPTWKPRALLTDDRPGPGPCPDAGQPSQADRQTEAG